MTGYTNVSSADDARQVADAAATGYVQVGNTRYPNSWVPAGKTIRQVSCAICDDTGDVLDDDGTFLGICGCTLGWLA